MNYVIHRNTEKDDELCHHGVMGQKWGIRRYQNPDGSYKSGAEGRYAEGTISGTKKNVSSSGPVRSVATGSSSSKAKSVSNLTKLSKSLSGKNSGGGGSSDPVKKTSEEEKTSEEKKSEGQAIDKTVNGKDINVKDVSEKIDKEAEKAAKKSSGSSSSGSSSTKKEETFKIDSIYDKMKELFTDINNMTDEEWEELELSDSDRDALDDLIAKYQTYKSSNSTSTKKTKSIDAFIERYGAWKSSHAKHSDFQDEYLVHHGILGMKWGIRRYQNEDGSYKPAGKERYNVKNSTNRHESTWYRKAENHNTDSNHYSGHTKQRVSKNGNQLTEKIAYRDSKRYNDRHGFTDKFTKQQHESIKKNYYDPVDVLGWKARSENDTRQFETRVARNEIMTKNNEASIHDLLETEIEKVENNGFLDTAKEKAEEILEDIGNNAANAYLDASDKVKDFFSDIFRKK